MFKNILTVFVLILISTGKASAHGRWIVPSHTILSGETPEAVSFQFSISNDVFHADHAYSGEPVIPIPKEQLENPRYKAVASFMASTKLHAFLPDGVVDTTAKIIDLKRVSAAAFMLKKSGTYRFSVQQDPIYLTWFKNKTGELDRIFGKPSMTGVSLPDGVSEVKTTRLINYVDTFVTRNNVSVPQIRSQGLDLDFLTHPNELFVGEEMKFKVLVDGVPATDPVKIQITKGQSHYRNQRDTMIVMAQPDSVTSVGWEQAGLYLLEAEVELPSSEEGVTINKYALYLTLEINPE